MMDSYVRPDEHACKGRMKRIFFELRYEVACELIGSYRSDVHVAMSMLMLIGYFHLATGRSIWRESEIVLYVRLF